jgi:hypothetical protein
VKRWEWCDLLVGRRSRLTSNARLIGFCLSRYLNDRGEAYPSVETLANDAGVCRRTAFRALAELKKHGYVYSRKRPFKSSLYRVRRPPWLPETRDAPTVSHGH